MPDRVNMFERFSQPLFRARITHVMSLILAYARTQFPGYDSATTDQAQLIDYRRATWEGWKLAQANLVEELVRIGQVRSIAAEFLKHARGRRESGKSTKAKLFLAELKLCEAIVRSAANTIVWLMFDEARWVPRRLWSGHPQVPITSIDATTGQLADELNEDPDTVAILSDITSLVQIGDLVVSRGELTEAWLEILEVKSGQINKRVIQAVERHADQLPDIPAEAVAELEREIGPSARKQADRIVRQIERGRNFETLVATDSGVDGVTGAPIRFVGSQTEVENYDETLRQLFTSATEGDLLVSCVEDCLWLGVHRDPPSIAVSKTAFESELDRKGLKIQSKAWHLNAILNDPTAKPLFLRELRPMDIMDVLQCRTIVWIYMDWSSFFESMQGHGVTCRWTSRKERAEHTNVYKADLGFRKDGRTPRFERGEASVALQSGMLGRIALEGLSPTGLQRLIMRVLDQSKGDTDSDD